MSRDPVERKPDDVIRGFREMMRRKGFSVSVKYQLVPEVGPGYIVTVVDPADANDVMMARWYSVEDLKCVCRANEIFWRYMI